MKTLVPPDVRVPVRPLVPGLLALVVGFSVVGLADSNGLRALGLLVAGLAFLFMQVEALERAMLAVVVLEIPLQIDAYLGHDLRVAEMNTLSGFNISVSTFILIVLYGLWLAQAAAGSSEPIRRVGRRVAPALVYVAAAVASLTVATNVTFSLYEVWLLVQALLILVYTVHAVRSLDDAVFLASLVVVGLAFQSAFAVGQAALGISIDFGPFSSRSVGERVASTVGSPNTFGSYLGLVLPVSLVLSIMHPRRGFRILSGVAFLLGAVALLLSFSRGAWLGFLVSMFALIMVMVARRWIRLGRVALVALFAAIPLVLMAGDAIAARVTGGSPAEVRLFLMQVALEMIADNPILGVGANNFAVALPPYLSSEATGYWISTVHNKYLLVWAEAGTLGLAAFLGFLWMSLGRGWRLVRLDQPGISPLTLGLMAGVIANVVHMNLDLFHSRPQVHLLWLVIGLIVGLHRLGREAAGGEDRSEGDRLPHATGRQARG